MQGFGEKKDPTGSEFCPTKTRPAPLLFRPFDFSVFSSLQLVTQTSQPPTATASCNPILSDGPRTHQQLPDTSQNGWRQRTSSADLRSTRRDLLCADRPSQGAKAAQKRERNAKNAGKDAKSQLKANEQARDIQCKVCFSTFLKTSRAPAYVLSLLFPNIFSHTLFARQLTRIRAVLPSMPRTSTPKACQSASPPSVVKTTPMGPTFGGYGPLSATRSQ